jgi:hypothetical protein
MDIRFFKDPDTGLAHCYGQHGIKEREVIETLRRPGRLFARDDGSLVAEGQTESGRYLRVIYREFLDEDYLFIITAYDLRGKARQAYRRKRKRP